MWWLIQAHAADLIAQLIAVGKVTSAVMNPLKCRGPAGIMVILRLQYDAILRQVTDPPAKQSKYLIKVKEVLAEDVLRLWHWSSYLSTWGMQIGWSRLGDPSCLLSICQSFKSKNYGRLVRFCHIGIEHLERNLNSKPRFALRLRT